jgi:hypothetical protein
MAAKKAARKRPTAKVVEQVIADRPGAKVVELPTVKQVEANPGARGYDETGRVRPADARAAFLVVPPAAAEALAETEESETGAAESQTPDASGPETAGDSTPSAVSGATEED